MDALIGWTGLVGATLAGARAFDARFRSIDIDSMRGRRWGLVVCAGVRAEKWKANRDPASDAAGIAALTAVLDTIQIERLVLISTADVYPVPTDVDERSMIDPNAAQPYGRHRLALERFCAERFPATIVRLPGLFGAGLKKNAIFDLLHANGVDRIHPASRYQFYNLARLWPDIERVLAASIPLVNLTAGPLSMAEIAASAFGRTLVPTGDVVPASYDIRSEHAARFGGADGYWYGATQTLDEITAFVEQERRRLAGPHR